MYLHYMYLHYMYLYYMYNLRVERALVLWVVILFTPQPLHEHVAQAYGGDLHGACELSQPPTCTAKPRHVDLVRRR